MAVRKSLFSVCPKTKRILAKKTSAKEVIVTQPYNICTPIYKHVSKVALTLLLIHGLCDEVINFFFCYAIRHFRMSQVCTQERRVTSALSEKADNNIDR